MSRFTKCMLVLLLGLAGSAMADVSPDVEVKLISPFVAVNTGEDYAGTLEIICGEPGTLSGLDLTGESWTANLNRAPGSASLRAGESLTVDFTARAVDPGQKLIFSCDFNGYEVRFPLDLSAENVRNMTEGAPVKPISAFEAPPGDPSWSEIDRILGVEPQPADGDSRRTITVSGRFGCNLSGGGYLPAHSITIEVWDQDTFGDDLLGTGSTNWDGYYTLDVESSGADIGSDPDIYVKFILQNSRMRVYEPSSGNNYVYSTGVQQNYSGTNLDFGSLIPANPDLQASVFQHTQGTRAWVRDWVLGYDVPAARIEWPSAAWPNCSPSGRIQMRQDFSWNDGTIWHEYGHWFDHEMASWEPFDYCNGICDASATECGHCFWCQESQAIAWLEGWAQFHGYSVSSWYGGYYGQNPLSGIDAENISMCGGSYDDPLLTEGFIAALTQDIADNNQDSHGVYGSYTDALATGVGAVYEVNALDNPTGSQDFANKFVARNPALRENFWETAANCGYWFDTTSPGPVLGLTSTSHTVGVGSPDPTIDFSWTRASDNYSGIQGYSISITASPSVPSTTVDLGDVTSYTTPALSPGSYYFNIRAVDNAGYWSGVYISVGPYIVRDPDPADLTPYLAAGWDYPLVPRTETDTNTGYAPLSASLPGDAALTYWNLYGQNQGEAATGSGFWAHLNIDGVFTQNVYWSPIQPNGLYYAPNWGPVYVPAGRHSFTSRHDATDLVSEIDENNNTFGRQFVWTPSPLPANTLIARDSPPHPTGGWGEVTSGPMYFNRDGLAMPTDTGWWHAMAVWADSDADDFDCSLYAPSTGPEDGFALFEAYSGSWGGFLDAVVVNRNQVAGASWDVGVEVYTGSGSYKAYHASSQIMAFGDSLTVPMIGDQPILLREFYLGTENLGEVSITAAADPTSGPLKLVVLNRDFTMGSLSSGSQVGSAYSNDDGLARVSANLDVAGWYGIMVYRDQTTGLPALDVTIEISTTPADLATWAPVGWHGPLTPRPALDGTPSSCPTPLSLFPSPDPTYLNVAATNLGPVPEILPTRIFHDGNYLSYVNWDVLAPGTTVAFNWNYPHLMPPGRHTLAFKVDALNEVEETDESNNVYGEQWVWDPLYLSPPMSLVRPAPPEGSGGQPDITVPEIFFNNCDGLRLQGTGLGYWKIMAMRPADGSDYDLRLHQPSSGAKDGFGASLVGSYEWGSTTEYVLVDQNSVAAQDYDVGVLNWYGDGLYRAQAASSNYIGSQPLGSWTGAVPDGGLVSLMEFSFPPGNYTIDLENLSGANLGFAVHQEGIAYQNTFSGVSWANFNGPGQNESATLEVVEQSYYCLLVYRDDQGTAEAPFQFNITNDLSPVGEDQVPLVTRLAGAYPNPFNPQTTVAFDLSQQGRARMNIYDLQGHLVRRLLDEVLPAGSHEAVWQGKNDEGRSVASGVYFVQLDSPGGKDMAKLVLVK